MTVATSDAGVPGSLSATPVEVVATDAAADLLAPWMLGDARLQLVARRENIVHRVETGDGRTYALRVHRPGYRSVRQLASELSWLEALGAAGVPVPAPVRTPRGARLVRAGDVHADLIEWLDGEPLGRSGAALALDDAPATFGALGGALARLHAATDAWIPPPGFDRPDWFAAELVGDAPSWGAFWSHPWLAPGQAELLLRFRDAAHEALARVGPSLDAGLIHADLVRENVLVGVAGEVAFIDFDDSAFGYRLFDVATALVKNLDEPDYPSLADALLAGYRSVRALDAGHLDLMLAVRAATYVGWTAERLGEPGNEARSSRAIHAACALCRTWLESET